MVGDLVYRIKLLCQILNGSYSTNTRKLWSNDRFVIWLAQAPWRHQKLEPIYSAGYFRVSWISSCFIDCVMCSVAAILNFKYAVSQCEVWNSQTLRRSDRSPRITKAFKGHLLVVWGSLCISHLSYQIGYRRWRIRLAGISPLGILKTGFGKLERLSITYRKTGSFRVSAKSLFDVV